MMVDRLALILALALGVASCSALPLVDKGDVGDTGPSAGYLFRASSAIKDDWTHMPLRGETDYSLAILGGRVAIRAVGRNSASGLMRRVGWDTGLCPAMIWEWSAPQLQTGANLHDRDADDVAASIFLLFGDPGPMFDPEPVPTLRYVWTTDHLAPGAIVDNPYMSGVVKSLVVRTGRAEPGTWYRQERNVRQDFIAAFGHPPADKVRAIALFTDNDQTREPVEAYYGWARAVCSEAGVSVEEELRWDE